MLEAFAAQLQTEAGLLCAGLLIALLFMTRAWQKERDENRVLQAAVLDLSKQAVAAEHETGAGLQEVRRLVDAGVETRAVISEVARELEIARQLRVQNANGRAYRSGESSP